MSHHYRTIFRIPGTAGFSLAGFVGRLPLSMAGIGVIMLLSQSAGSYAQAGIVAGVLAVAIAVFSPQVSRWVDRIGQKKVLPVAAAISVTGIVLLLVLAHRGAPVWALCACAALAGCMPSMSAMVRARWTALLRGDPRMRAAYAWESMLDEVSFIIGAPLSIGLSAVWFPAAGLVAALVLQCIGVVAFVLQGKTEPAIESGALDSSPSPIRLLSMKMLFLLAVAMGTIVGAIDVMSVAFATQQGQVAAASVVLSVYAIGSCLAGLYFGARNWKPTLPRQLLYCGIASAVTTLPIAFATNTVELAIAMLINGIFFAPTIIVTMAIIERVVPAARLTEGFTWIVSGLGIGVALGAASVGQVVDRWDVQAGFGVTLVAGVMAMVVAVSGQRSLAAALAENDAR